MDTSFDDREKRFILAEMVKASHLDIGAVINFVKHYNIAPDWHEMQIPHGRTINQCRQAAASMGIETPLNYTQQHPQQQYQQPGPQYPQQHQQPDQQHPPPPQQHQQYQQHQPPQHLQHHYHHQHPKLPLPPSFPASKRKPSSDSSEYAPKRQAVSPAEIAPTSQARSIQPRPPPGKPYPVNGAPPSGVTTVRLAPGAALPPVQPLPRKRGRPSRADKVAQAQAARLSSNHFPFLAPASKPPPTNTPLASKPLKMYNYGQSVDFPPRVQTPVVLSPAAPLSTEASSRRPSGESPKLDEQPKEAPLKQEISPTNITTDNPLPERPRTPPKPKSPVTEDTPPRSAGTPPRSPAAADQP